MRLRLLTLLILISGFHAHATGQDYFASGKKTGSVNQLDGILTTDVNQSDASRDSGEEEQDAAGAYLSIFKGLAPEETNTGTDPETRRLPVVVEEIVKPGEKASADRFRKL